MSTKRTSLSLKREGTAIESVVVPLTSLTTTLKPNPPQKNNQFNHKEIWNMIYWYVDDLEYLSELARALTRVDFPVFAAPTIAIWMISSFIIWRLQIPSMTCVKKLRPRSPMISKLSRLHLKCITASRRSTLLFNCFPLALIGTYSPRNGFCGSNDKYSFDSWFKFWIAI